MKRISAVTFDLWDTLIQEVPGNSDKVSAIRVDRIWRILNDRGMIHSRSEVESAYGRTFDFLQLTWSKSRDVPVKDHILFMLTSVDSKLAGRLAKEDIAHIEKIYSEAILEHPPRLLAGAKDALTAVRDKGYRMGLISNTGRTPGSMLRIVMGKLGILEHFDTATFSDEILFRKPNELAFNLTLERLRASPKTAVHVGDDSEKDILGAKKVGMRTVQYAPDAKNASKHADARVTSLDQVLEKIEAF
jgi:putative hydrolase of the HAD superfamily